MEEIRIGLEEGLDVSWYANLKFNEKQMEEIREGLIKGVRCELVCKTRV